MNAVNKASTRPASVLLNKFGLIAAALLLILAAWAGQTVIVILLGLGLAAAGLTRLWSHYSLKGVRCERQLNECRTFPEGILELKLRVANRKLLPLPWLQVTDEVPSGFNTEGTPAPGNRIGFDLISRTTSIMWYSAVIWKFRLLCKKRGYYTLGPLTVTSGDIFGFYPRSVIETAEDHIIVYPVIFEIRNLVIPSLYPMGEAKSNNRLFEDPSRTIGIRDYSPGDNLRRIHWKASARHQQLQVKVFEPTTSLRAAIFLAIDSFQDEGLWNHDDEELGISTAASLAHHLIDINGQTGLWVNSQLADTGNSARIPLRSGVDQLMQVLEALAKVVSVPSSPFAEFLNNERRNLPLGTTLIFIFRRIPEKLKEILADLKETGYQILVFQIGEVDKSNLPAEITWFQVRPPGELIEISRQES
jgi:uncharacterized protein (DUF58 family)